MHNPGPEADYIQIALEASGIGTWQLDISAGLLHPDKLSAGLFGFTSQESFQYRLFFENIHQKKRKQVQSAIEAAIDSKKDIDIKYRLAGKGTDRQKWVHLKGKYINDRYAGTIRDISSETEISFAQLESEYRYRSIIEEAPVATALYVGRELVIEIVNDVMLSYWGKDNSVIGMKLDEAIPELEGQPFVEILKNIFDTGEIYQVTEEPVVLASHGVVGTYYFDFTYKPLYNTEGEIYAIMNMAVEVTEKVISKRDLVISEDRYRSIIQHAPVATCLFVGRDLKVEVANDIMIGYWGKERKSWANHWLKQYLNLSASLF